jgi:hypothetical protein
MLVVRNAVVGEGINYNGETHPRADHIKPPTDIYSLQQDTQSETGATLGVRTVVSSDGYSLRTTDNDQDNPTHDDVRPTYHGFRRTIRVHRNT